MDFGDGFYLSDDINTARTFGYRTVRVRGGHLVISVFTVDEEKLFSKTTVKQFREADAEWFDFIVANRHSATSTDYDVITGSVADILVEAKVNEYIASPDDFEKEAFINSLQPYIHPNQYAFKTDVAINLLTFVESI
jgi:hypothetical protein